MLSKPLAQPKPRPKLLDRRESKAAIQAEDRPVFDGATYEPAEDQQRLAHQLDRVKIYMGDHSWRTLAEIARTIGASEASVSARLRDLRKPRHGRYVVERQRVGRGLFAYRVLPPAEEWRLPL